MKWLQLGLLALIAAALLWGTASVRSFPRHSSSTAKFAPTRPAPTYDRGHIIECDSFGYVPFDSTDARWCARALLYLRDSMPSHSVVDTTVARAAAAFASRP